MAEGITLLEITVEPTRGINEIIKEGYEAVLHGLRKAHAKKFHAFKVLQYFSVLLKVNLAWQIWQTIKCNPPCV